MEPGRIVEWETLTCAACGSSTSFLAITELRVRQGQGMVPTVKGYECQICHVVANPGELQNGAEIRRRERAIRQQEEELAALRMRQSPGSTS